MPDCTWPSERPVLVMAFEPSDVRLARDASAELGVPHHLVDDDIAALRTLCHRPSSFAAVIVGDRAGPASGLTICGVARDAGCALPLLLLTGEESRPVADRAARLGVTVLWRPVSSRRLARTLSSMMPRRRCQPA
jgi:hypothetical protein